jgi:hypothetical protein
MINEQYNKYIHIPKPVQNYLEIRNMIRNRINEQVMISKCETHNDFMQLLNKNEG